MKAAEFQTLADSNDPKGFVPKHESCVGVKSEPLRTTASH